MTVKELIKELKKQHPNGEVFMANERGDIPVSLVKRYSKDDDHCTNPIYNKTNVCLSWYIE